jgi:hypothetical protein
MVFTSCIKAAVEGMTSNGTENFMNTDEQKYFKQLLMISIWLVVTLMVGMWLWNNVAVKLVSVLKPMTSIWQLLGLALIIDLINPSCCY